MNKTLEKYIRQIVTETINEDYPQSFNMDYFKTLKTFKDKIVYCEQNLQRISSGSSRIVYKIDDEKVLKLAKNPKGLAQNAVEIKNGFDYLLKSVVPKVFNYDEDNQWFETQLANKITKSKFQQIVGVSWDDYVKLIQNYAIELRLLKNRFKHKISKDIDYESWENEFIRPMYDYIGDYQIYNDDLIKPSSYGIVKENGFESVKLIDSGLTNEVFNQHYK